MGKELTIKGCDVYGYPLDPNHPWYEVLRYVTVSVTDGVSRGRRVGDLPEFQEPALQLNDPILRG